MSINLLPPLLFDPFNVHDQAQGTEAPVRARASARALPLATKIESEANKRFVLEFRGIPTFRSRPPGTPGPWVVSTRAGPFLDLAWRRGDDTVYVTLITLSRLTSHTAEAQHTITRKSTMVQ